MKVQQKEMLKRISCIKEKSLFISLCGSRHTTAFLIKHFGHRFSKYICDIREKFGFEIIKREHLGNRKYLYWINKPKKESKNDN